MGKKTNMATAAGALIRSDGKEVRDCKNHRMMLLEVTKRIAMGDTREEIVEWLQQDGYAESTSRGFYNEANRKLLTKYRSYTTRVAKQNLMRLEVVIREAYEAGDRKSLLSAIDMQNKLVGAYTQRIELNTDTIKITFGTEDVKPSAVEIEEGEAADEYTVSSAGEMAGESL